MAETDTKHTDIKDPPSRSSQLLAKLAQVEEPKYAYDLAALPDPPQGWQFLGRTATQSNYSRDRDLPPIVDLRTLLKFHYWGIKSVFKKKYRATKTEVIQALWKLFYYQAEEHRPKSWMEIADSTRDTGPRLLRMDLHPTPQPYSRYFPVLPSVATVPGFIRPANTPAHIPDSYVIRFLYSVQFPDTEMLQPSMPGASDSAQTSQTHQSPSDIPMGRANAAFAELSTQGSGSNAVMSHVRVAIERLMMDLLYRDLSRDATSPYPSPVARRIAVCREDLKIVQVGVFPSIREVFLEKNTLEFNVFQRTDMEFYPYRGRGPVWRNSSCSVDSIIVLGMLCDVGCTVIDRMYGRAENFTVLEKAFIEVTNFSWDRLEDEVSSDCRDLFWKQICNVIPSIKMGEPTPTWLIWSECVKNFAQFHTMYKDLTYDCPCQGGSLISEDVRLSDCIAPALVDSDVEGVDVASMIMRVLLVNTQIPCSHCQANPGGYSERRILTLAPRLVVTHYTGKKAKILNHTEDVSFQYFDADGNMATATYRWFGGIYYKDGHVRNYHPDARRGEQDDGTVCMYDGALNSGIIIGGVPPYDPRDRVPIDWVEAGLMIVVYELVKNPGDDLFNEAASAIQKMHDVAQTGKQIFRDTDWPLQCRKPSAISWSRVMPILAESWQESSRAELPPAINLPPGQLSVKEVAEAYAVANPPLYNPYEFFPGQQAEQAVPQDIATYSNAFDSIDNGLDVFSMFPELWPDGQPGPEGALCFPSLPRSPPKSSSGDQDLFRDFCRSPSSSSRSGSSTPKASLQAHRTSSPQHDQQRDLDTTMEAQLSGQTGSRTIPGPHNPHFPTHLLRHFGSDAYMRHASRDALPHKKSWVLEAMRKKMAESRKRKQRTNKPESVAQRKVSKQQSQKRNSRTKRSSKPVSSPSDAVEAVPRISSDSSSMTMRNQNMVLLNPTTQEMTFLG